MPDRPHRRLAAIVAADVAGYSRLIGLDEEGTLKTLRDIRREIVDPLLREHGGRIANTAGDSMLLEFPSVVDAVRCSVAIQTAVAVRNADLPDGRRLTFRVGINLGDVVRDGDDLLGDGVNVAARLEGVAEAGGIALSDDAYRQVRDRIEAAWDDAGEQALKNIARPVRVWRWSAARPETRPVPAAGPGAGVAASDKPSIAVLPLDNMSGDPEQGYFADGIAEDIITDLSKVSGLIVIARNSSFAYRGRSQDLRTVCRELGVRYALEGSVRRAGNRVRINAQLIDGATGGHLWAERFDRDLADIFAVQDEVTREIVAALRVALTAGEESRRAGRRKVDPEAYDLVMRGRECVYRFTAESLAESHVLLERAIALEPRLATARAVQSVAHGMEYFNGWNGDASDHLNKALAIAEEACRIDPAEPHAYHALALANLWRGDLAAAERAATRSVELNPNFAGGHGVLGSARDLAGDHAGAIACAEKMIGLDPRYDVGMHLLGRALFALGRDDEAQAAFERRLALNPKSDNSRAFLAAIHGFAGRHDEARRRWRELREINPRFSVAQLRQRLHYKSPAVLDRLADGLARAGLSD